MKQVNVHGPDDVRLDDVPAPDPGPRDAVVRVAACGICGSDVGYVKLGGLAGPTRDPMPLGHELAGVIEDVGAEVEGLPPGTRVVLNPSGARIGNGGREGGFAPRLLVRGAADGGSLFPIPDALSFEDAALTEPLGIGMNAVDRSEARAGEKIVVFGAGPIGLAAVATLADRGIEDVVSVDLSDTRLAIARRLGAAETLHAGRDDVWGRLAEIHGTATMMGAPVAASDAFIEASGASSVITDVIARARPEARLAVVALHRAPVEVNFLLVMMKQLTVRGAMEYPTDYTEMIRLLERRDLSAMITHRFPLSRFPEAFAVARDPETGGKVMIDMQEETP